MTDVSIVESIPVAGVSGQVSPGAAARSFVVYRDEQLLIPMPDFNAPGGEWHLSVLVNAAAALPGDMEAPDEAEAEAERADVTAALADVQLGLIARQGE